jgi:tetratricopeptide (TPR) repeat protein
MDESKQAISDLTRAIRLNPRSQLAYEWRGCCHLNLQEYDDAVDDLTKALVMNPYDAYAYGARGGALTYRGDCAKAIEDYNRSIQLDPKDYHPYGGRSAAYTILSQSAAADRDREAAKKLGGQAAETWTQQCTEWARYREELRGNAGGPKDRTDGPQSGPQ